jgi:hypothetical protein
VDTALMLPSRSLPGAVSAAGLLGGFALGHVTGRRDLAGAAFGLASVWSARRWATTEGPGTAAALTGASVAAMGVAHPLARRVGPWPAVLLVTAAFLAGSEAVVRRR